MNVRLTTLQNRMTVITHDMPHLQSVALGVWIKSGARSELNQDHGISHLLEHMAFKGTQRRTARDIAEAIEAVGGEVNAATSVEATSYYVRLMKDDIALGIDVLSDILSYSTFDPVELAREKHVIQQEIGAAADMPEDRAFDLFQSAAFPDQAIGRTILGTPNSIEGFTPEDLKRFLNTHYCGPNMILSAAGRVDHAEIVSLAEEHFSTLPGSEAPPIPKGHYQGGCLLEERDLQEAQLLIGFQGPEYGAGELYAGQLLSAILGGGMASRLFQEVRETRGLCYSIYAFQWPFRDTGLFAVHAATSKEDLGELVPVVLDEFLNLSAGIEADELERAKCQMRAGLLMALESPAARAGQMARHVQMHGRPIELAEIVNQIDKVSAKQLEDLARRIFSSPPSIAAVGPLAKLPDFDNIKDYLHPTPGSANGSVHGVSSS